MGGKLAINTIRKQKMSKDDNAKTLLSIEDFNEIDQCKDAEEMEFLDQDGEPTGITVMVLGSKAAKVTKWLMRNLDKQERWNAQQARKGNKAEIQPTAEKVEFGTEYAAIRIVSWKGITEECTPQMALHFCTVNDLFRSQVLEFSEDLGNFCKNS